MSGKIMYCAMPTRFTKMADWPSMREKIIETAVRWGYAPTIPFDIGEYKYFEGGTIGRKRTIEYMIHMMRFCDTVGIFGISDGALGELKTGLDEGKEIRVCYGLDPEWEKYYEQLKDKYGDLLQRLRGPNTLIALVGASAIGKTFWSDELIKHFGGGLKRVKSTTTRQPREPKDYDSYNFVGVEEFQKGIEQNLFLEWDQYLENYYGSSWLDVKATLKESSGIFAITPEGAKAFYNCRMEMNLKFILMVPESEAVLRNNYARRGISDPVREEELLSKVSHFDLPQEIPHELVVISGDTEKDREKLLRVVEPLIVK